jgi:metal-responsive CopG/Arc/MetJ family transcriptional regulator
MTRPNLVGTAGELPIVSLKVPQTMLERIDELAREDMTTRSAIIRRAILAMFREAGAGEISKAPR